MSESQVSLMLRRMGLWARRDLRLGQDGRVLGGRIDPYAELLYTQLFSLHDDILDRSPLSSVEERFLTCCQDFISRHRSKIRELERQFA